MQQLQSTYDVPPSSKYRMQYLEEVETKNVGSRNNRGAAILEFFQIVFPETSSNLKR